MLFIEETANKPIRVRYQIQSTAQLDFKAESVKLAEMIKQYDMNSDSLFV
jgi:hypothetical protein